MKWIREGPAHGLRRQHRFTRNVAGWVPTIKSTGVVSEVDARDELDDLEGVSKQGINELEFQQAENFAPATAHQEADQQADMWHRQWGAGCELQEIRWPDHLGDELHAILAEEICEAAKTFPDETGLGWDRCHPKVVCRLSPQLQRMLVEIMLECERTGTWPKGVGLVLIALLEKNDGGFRPIGLLPCLPRLWMRARRNVAKKWEEENKRTWLYAGKGKGANVAAWTQAAAAERAAALRPSVEYAQALLDLVKAFDRVPLWLLVDEADALGYPLTILRLSIATYKLERVIRIGNAVSKSVWAYRGITAGSGFATTEMRIIMLRVVDRACKLYPMVGPTLFVDDLAADVTAPATLVVQQLGGFIETVASFIEDTKQELSKTKSLLTASTKKIGDLLCCRWKENGILIMFR